MATELAQIEHSHDCKHCVEQWCLDFLCWGMTKGIIVLRFLVLSILVAFGFVYKFIWFFSLCYCLFGIQFSLVKSCFPVLFYSFPKRWWLLGVDQDEARRLELTPGVSYDWQWLKYFKHHASRMHTGRKLEVEAEPEFQHCSQGCTHFAWHLYCVICPPLGDFSTHSLIINF